MPSRTALIRLWLLSVALTLMVFGLWPQADLIVTGWFYRTGQGFPLADLPAVEGPRQALWFGAEAMALVSAIGLGAALWRRAPALWLPARIWGFILALFAAGPGLIVNGILKEYWGRARPDTVTEFGGERLFTAPFWPAGECARNCSFVSGEASAAMALAIAIAVILCHLRPRLSPALWRAGLAVVLILPPIGIALRVMAGRHFLSDAVTAAVLVAGLALLLHRLILRETPPDPVLTSLPTPPIRRDT